ncbi:MAG: SDR family oxidoreductase [Chitinophagaceae bacterium]|nr:MAG: SDR family oxidoreductase [Chitinophagaceae bacterium]
MKRNGESFAGTVVVITGASSGAGRAIALALTARGARTVLAARNRDALEGLRGEIAGLGGECLVVPTDTREPAQQLALAEAARSAYGRIDVWVNNAGVLAAGALEDVPAEINEGVIRTNLLGYVHGAQAVLPLFKYQGYGILINNISVGGWLPTPYMAAYCASKFGLKGFSEALRGELAAYPDIYVCDLFPGFLDTPGIQHAANYTGKVLRPAPPLYDPRLVADGVVQTILQPRRARALGLFPHLLHAAYSLFPALSRRVTGGFIRHYLKAADSTVHTAGNVLHTVDYGNAVDGGWRAGCGNRKPPATKIALGALGALALLAFFGRR